MINFAIHSVFKIIRHRLSINFFLSKLHEKGCVTPTETYPIFHKQNPTLPIITRKQTESNLQTLTRMQKIPAHVHRLRLLVRLGSKVAKVINFAIHSVFKIIRHRLSINFFLSKLHEKGCVTPTETYPIFHKQNPTLPIITRKQTESNLQTLTRMQKIPAHVSYFFTSCTCFTRKHPTLPSITRKQQHCQVSQESNTAKYHKKATHIPTLK